MALVMNTEIELENLINTVNLVLLNVRTAYAYENRVKTDVVKGHIYTLGNQATCEQFDVNVQGTSALITSEDLAIERTQGVVYVNIVGGIAKAYQDYNTKMVKETIRAKEVVFAD
ncbi:hypothetical protein Q5O14_17750 [Eubacteriaceae bacterium ES2]|nr:hypothetical protein Q5O14_17750 [Eubacteriaceae bacterium ES2]